MHSAVVPISPKSTSINQTVQSLVHHGEPLTPRSTGIKQTDYNTLSPKVLCLRTFLFRNHVFLHDAFVPLIRIQLFLEDVSSRISVFFTILMIYLTLPCCHPLSAVTLCVICPFSIGSYTSCWTPAPQVSSVLHQYNQALHSSCRSRSQRTLHSPMAFIR